MKKSFVRFMGLLTAILLVVTMIPATAFADHTTEGAPNVFSVVTTDEGDYTQNEFLLVETLTRNGETYYGLMLRRGINAYYGSSIKVSGVLNLDLVADETRTSTDTVNYQKFVLRNIVNDNGSNKGVNGADMNSLIDMIYPEEMISSIATLEHTITNYENVNYNIVDSITIPSPELIINNLDYLYIADNGSGWTGAWATGKNGYSPTYKWIYAIGNDGVRHYGQLGSQYDYYSVLPIVYVTADFFENVKIDTTKEVGEDIKNLLAGKYYQKELKHLGYTDEDFEILTVPLQPEVLTPEWSPNYVKTADGTLELFYNDTMVVSGETYVGFTVAKDYAGSTVRTGAGFQKVETDSAGKPIPDATQYGQYKFCTPNWNYEPYKAFKYWDSIDVIKDELPQAIQNNMLLNTWTAGSTYWLGGSPHGAAKSISYISLPSGTEMANHGAYLAAQMTDNANPYANGTHKTAIVRDPYTYACGVYDPAQNMVINTGLSSAYAWGSVFPTFYVNIDFMKSLKLDVNTMSDNVRALFTSNFIRSDLAGVYTDAELDELGIQSFTAEEKPASSAGASFTVDGTSFILMNTTKEINGDKYIGVLSKAPTANYANYRLLLNYTDVSTTDMKVVMSHATKDQAQHTLSELKSINDYASKFSVFGDAIAPSDTEWLLFEGKSSIGYYPEESVTISHVGSVGIPSREQFSDVFKYDTLTVASYSAGIVSGTMSYDNNSKIYYFSYHDADGTHKGNSEVNRDNDALGTQGWRYNGATYYFMTYVKADWFKTADIDMSTAGDYAKDILRANFTATDLSAWSDANLSALFDSSYTGRGLGLVVYRTGEASVSVVINNNNPEDSTGSKAVVVAAYSKDGLEGSAVIKVAGTIPANSYTSKLQANLNVSDDVEITEIKVMLWDSIDNMKPLADIVCVN